MSKRTRTSVRNACDRLWSKLVRTLAGFRCEKCGASPEDQRGFHAHHVYGRVNYRLRFEHRNGTALCYPCHRWAEEYPLEFADWFREVRGDDAEWLAEENLKGLIRRDLADYLELEQALQNLLSEAAGGDLAA